MRARWTARRALPVPLLFHTVHSTTQLKVEPAPHACSTGLPHPSTPAPHLPQRLRSAWVSSLAIYNRLLVERPDLVQVRQGCSLKRILFPEDFLKGFHAGASAGVPQPLLLHTNLPQQLRSAREAAAQPTCARCCSGAPMLQELMAPYYYDRKGEAKAGELGYFGRPVLNFYRYSKANA